MPVRVEVRGAGEDLLHRTVRVGWAALLAALADADRVLPAYVVAEVEDYLGCGDARRGFAWLACVRCDFHRLVPYSCKGRGFCPACGGRRMAERAAAWVDGGIPPVAVRQWVLTVPWPRRWLLARRPEVLTGVLERAMAQIQGWYGRSGGRGGAITVIQRFPQQMEALLAGRREPGVQLALPRQ
jgi:hypothetical protein